MPLCNGRYGRMALGAAAGLIVLLVTLPSPQTQVSGITLFSAAWAQSHKEGAGGSGGKKGGSGGGHASSHPGSHDEGSIEEEHDESGHAGGKHQGGQQVVGKRLRKGQGTGVAGAPGAAGHGLEDKVFREPGHEKGPGPEDHDTAGHDSDHEHEDEGPTL